MLNIKPQKIILKFKKWEFVNVFQESISRTMKLVKKWFLNIQVWKILEDRSSIKPSEEENVGQSETLKQTIKENVKILLF